MPLLIRTHRELIRINTVKNTIESSSTEGRSWVTRFNGSSAGTFSDLLLWDGEILAITSRGLFYSTTDGQSWVLRCLHNVVGTFHSLQDGGGRLLADTARGCCYSTNGGRSWVRY